MNPRDILTRFPNASKSVLAANSGDYGKPHENNSNPAGLPDTEPAQQARALDKYDAREAQGPRRHHVCFTLHRVRLLDVDAKWGSTKDCLDFLATCGLIPGDREDQITLEVRQVKVDHYRDEKTLIEVETP